MIILLAIPRLFIMTFIPYLSTIAKAFAIAGLALVAPSTYYFRMYSRVLDFAQMLFVFATVFSSGTTIFSSYLDYSFLSFMPTFLDSYCTTGDFLCTYGFLISPAVSWLGAAVLLFIIVRIVACKKRDANFQAVYNFWKGLTRWFMVPLVYYSTKMLIAKLKANLLTSYDCIGSLIVLGVYFLLIHFELIGYKCTQKEEENVWKKWLEYFSNWRIISVVVIAVLSSDVNSLAQYFIYGPLVIFDIFHVIKYKYSFRVFERVFFLLGEAVMITLYSLFIFSPSYISLYDLDCIGLALVILLDLILFFPKLYSYCKGDNDEADPEVNPEIRKTDNRMKRGNSFIEAEDIKNQLSIDELNGSSNNSPRRPPPNQSPNRRR